MPALKDISVCLLGIQPLFSIRGFDIKRCLCQYRSTGNNTTIFQHKREWGDATENLMQPHAQQS